MKLFTVGLLCFLDRAGFLSFYFVAVFVFGRTKLFTGEVQNLKPLIFVLVVQSNGGGDLPSLASFTGTVDDHHDLSFVFGKMDHVAVGVLS